MKIKKESVNSKNKAPKKVALKTIDKKSKSIVQKTQKNVKKVPQSKPVAEVKKSQQNISALDESYCSKISEQFTIPVSAVKSAVEGVLKFAAENPKNQNKLFDEKTPLFLEVNTIKIPKCKPKLLRILLKHSLIGEGSEVCLIVPDSKETKASEHEKQVEFFEELLKKKGITSINKILTFHQVKTEYETFELKRGLVELYDMFLADARIAGRIVGKLGQKFYEKRKVPVPVKLYATNLTRQIDQALRKTAFQVHNRGDSFKIQFGDSQMKHEKLIENVFSVLEGLKEIFPGGFDNIKTINVNGHRATSIPIYVSLKNPNEVITPVVKNKKPKAFKSVKGELTTQLGSKVTVRPSGQILITGRRSDKIKAKKAKQKFSLLIKNPVGTPEENNSSNGRNKKNTQIKKKLQIKEEPTKKKKNLQKKTENGFKKAKPVKQAEENKATVEKPLFKIKLKAKKNKKVV